MDEPDWLVQIYAVSDAVAQAKLLGHLASVPNLTVEATSSGRDSFLIIECSGDEQAWSVHQFVVSSDPGATLLHTSQAATVSLAAPDLAEDSAIAELSS